MYLTLLKSKLHKATVTDVCVDYEGSCAIDGTLLDSVGILEYEQIQVFNASNGERFTTYAIRAENGSGIISVRGAAAHKANPGDWLIICAFAQVPESDLLGLKPTVIYLDQENRKLAPISQSTSKLGSAP